jgi:phenylacetate-CoA ligase
MNAENSFQNRFWFGRLDATIFLWKYCVIRKNAVSTFQRSLREDRLPPEDLEKLNWDRTRDLLRYAYENVSFYRKRLDSIGMNPSDITLPEHYSQVPLLSKQDVREHFQDLISVEAKPRDLRLSTTGGSTGEPLKVYHQKQVVRSAMMWRMFLWWGLHPGLTYASVYRQQFSSVGQKLGQWLANWPGRRIHLDAADLTPESMNLFLDQFRQHKPELLHGYVGAVDELAAFVLSESLEIPPPKVVWVTSSPVTELQRLRIQKAFRAPVCDQYGCCEVYWLAAQCPRLRGLHMFQDVRRIEFVDDSGKPVPKGETGDIVVTDFDNRYFPFIRYKIGDRGRGLEGPCDCGVTLPLMDHVRGRVTDTVKTPSGKRISGDYLTTIFDDTPDAVRQFQVYQLADYGIELRVVPNPACPDLRRILREVEANLTQRLRDEVPVKVIQCEAIPHIKGKQRYVVSEVKG